MASRRLTIQNRLVTILQGITTGNGYHNNVVAVGKRFKDIQKVNSHPELFVLSGGQDHHTVDEARSIYEVVATFVVVGTLAVDEELDTSANMNDASDELIEDIVEVLLTDATLYANTKAKWIEVTSSQPPEFGTTKGYVAVFLEVGYHHGTDA